VIIVDKPVPHANVMMMLVLLIKYLFVVGVAKSMKMIYEYKCKNCMKLTVISLSLKREVITCKYCNGEATKNGKLSDKPMFCETEKIPKRKKNDNV
jgi:DNA-directed RNA polymerase subunit RPC12/RpoP